MSEDDDRSPLQEMTARFREMDRENEANIQRQKDYDAEWRQRNYEENARGGYSDYGDAREHRATYRGAASTGGGCAPIVVFLGLGVGVWMWLREPSQQRVETEPTRKQIVPVNAPKVTNAPAAAKSALPTRRKAKPEPSQPREEIAIKSDRAATGGQRVVVETDAARNPVIEAESSQSSSEPSPIASGRPSGSSTLPPASPTPATPSAESGPRLAPPPAPLTPTALAPSPLLGGARERKNGR